MRVGLISVLVGILLAGCSGVDLNDGQVRIAASNQPSGGAVDQGIFRQYLPNQSRSEHADHARRGFSHHPRFRLHLQLP